MQEETQTSQEPKPASPPAETPTKLTTPAQPQQPPTPASQTPTPTSTQPEPPKPPEAQPPVKKKGCCSCLNCFFACVILFIILTLGTASAMAASGLYNIPLLSSWLYKEPAIREIKPLNDKDLTKKLKSVGLSGKSVNSSKTIDIEFTQDEAAGYLIGLTQGTGTISNTQFGIVEKANLNIQPQEVEAIILIENPLSLLPLSRKKIWIDSKFLPQVQNSQLSLRIDKVKIGNLSFPLKLADSIFHYSNQLKAIPISGLKSLQLKDGSFKATMEPANLVE